MIVGNLAGLGVKVSQGHGLGRVAIVNDDRGPGEIGRGRVRA